MRTAATGQLRLEQSCAALRHPTSRDDRNFANAGAHSHSKAATQMPPKEHLTKLTMAILSTRRALACMHEELENWGRRPGPSRGLARMDDEMSAALVALVAEAAQMQGAVLGCLNGQSMQTEEGEETSSEWALAAAAALVEWRPTLEERRACSSAAAL
jgi:hypothetical protein